MERNQVAINLESNRLVAVAAGVQAGRITVRAWLSVPRPATLDLNDTAAAGRWVASELKRAKLWSAARRGRVIFAVSRGEVVMKRIAFPPGTDSDELPGMVRLQLVRQLTVSPENAAIDFVPIDDGESGAAVLAAALQGDRLEWRRAVCRAAGLRLGRVALQSAGAAALLAEVAQGRTGGTLGVALGAESTEFVIVEGGQLVFARATDLVRPASAEETDGFAQKVAVEAKRTWMSYRAAPDAPVIEAVTVLGSDALSRLVAQRCAETLDLPSEAVDFPRYVEIAADMPEAERSAVAPLIGLLAEPAIGRATLDFASPRRVPDFAGQRRRLVLLGALAAIVVGGSAFTAARLDLQRRAAELADLQREWGVQSEQHAEFVRMQARLEHIKRFRDNEVDWLAHLNMLSAQMPDPRDALLDSVTAKSDVEVVYAPTRDQTAYAPAAWAVRHDGSMSIAGSMKRREIADALRARLVADQRYSVQTRGSDLPDRFDWTLTTRLRTPDDAPGPRAAEITTPPPTVRNDPAPTAAPDPEPPAQQPQPASPAAQAAQPPAAAPASAPRGDQPRGQRPRPPRAGGGGG
ncbi:MAG: pilus assembly protein PilM [Phycisphaeraceae bacterium]|nr:pilus assembly protein PilM [Phycisphaeraceae bacterium]MBX3405909.1 pilus assembly protein PilM [Phycisphaeraceae bacterium]